jgi:hypothetical protein
MKITRKVALLLGVIAFSIVLGVPISHTEAQSSNNTNQSTTTKTNFAEQISQQISSDESLVFVVYESPTTVILQGDNEKIITGGSGFNDLLWRAVDLLKDKGFTIDKIDSLPAPAPENPYLSVRTQIYQIFMSKGG